MSQSQRQLIEGQPVLVVIDIQGGDSAGAEPSTIPFMPEYQAYMDRAPGLIAKARECRIPIVFFQAAHAAALRAMEYLQSGACRTTAEVMTAFTSYAGQQLAQ